MRQFLGELGLRSPYPVPFRSDNKGAIDLAYDPEHHQRTKHIERRRFFIREAVENMEIRVPYVARPVTTWPISSQSHLPPIAVFCYAERHIMNLLATHLYP